MDSINIWKLSFSNNSEITGVSDGLFAFEADYQINNSLVLNERFAQFIGNFLRQRFYSLSEEIGNINEPNDEQSQRLVEVEQFASFMNNTIYFTDSAELGIKMVYKVNYLTMKKHIPICPYLL
jgi:hypothetical protein